MQPRTRLLADICICAHMYIHTHLSCSQCMKLPCVVADLVLCSFVPRGCLINPRALVAGSLVTGGFVFASSLDVRSLPIPSHFNIKLASIVTSSIAFAKHIFEQVSIISGTKREDELQLQYCPWKEESLGFTGNIQLIIMRHIDS